MAKALLWVAALLGSLVLVYSDSNNVITDGSDLEDGRIKLRCIATENMTTFYWTLNGYKVPPTVTQPNSLLLELPMSEADGHVACHVKYGEILSVSGSLIRNSAGEDDTWRKTVAIDVVLGSLFLLFILVYIVNFVRWCRKQRRRAALRGQRLFQRHGSGSQDGGGSGSQDGGQNGGSSGSQDGGQDGGSGGQDDGCSGSQAGGKAGGSSGSLDGGAGGQDGGSSGSQAGGKDGGAGGSSACQAGGQDGGAL